MIFFEDITLWQVLSFFSLIAFFWIIYAVLTDRHAASRDRDEQGLGLFDDLSDRD